MALGVVLALFNDVRTNPDIREPAAIEDAAWEQVQDSPLGWLVEDILIVPIPEGRVGAFVTNNPPDGIITLDLRPWTTNALDELIDHEIGHLLDFALWEPGDPNRKGGLGTEAWAECAAVDAGTRRVDPRDPGGEYHCFEDELAIYQATLANVSQVCKRWGDRECRSRRQHITYGLGACVLIAANWVVFLWAIDNGRAVEAALGYFLMPLFSVALGVGLLGERLRSLQKGALVLAVIGIVWTLVAVGTVPWVALILGGSFALYGWARKQGPWNAVDGLTFETMLLVPFLLPLLFWRGAGEVAVTGDGTWTTLLLIAATGLVTIVPLLLFASAARQVSLTLVGLLQYINPTLQFLVGWQILGESVSTARLFGFGWIWAALGLVVVDELGSKRPVDRGAASLR